MRTTVLRTTAWRSITAVSASMFLAATFVQGAVAPPAAQAAEPGPGVSIVLSGSPGTPVVNPRTDTVYVPIQCPTSYCTNNEPGTVVDIVNGALCNASVQTRCSVVATAPAGDSPLGAAVDQKTGTVYFAGANGTVTLLDGARCNATHTTGCHKDLATLNVGGFLVDAAVDPLTKTLYVADPKDGFVLVIDIAKCSAVTTTGCASAVKTMRKVNDPHDAQSLDIDLATDTVYTADNGTGNGNTVSVIDGATCNGTHSNGCREAPRTVQVGSGAFWDAVDQANDTVYVANNNDGTVSVINGAKCNSKVTSGCATAPTVLHTGAGPSGVAVDGALHTLFTINASDDTLSEVSAKTCNGTVTSGCPPLALNEQATPDQGPAAFANTVVLAPRTSTAYLANTGGPDIMSVVSVAACNALDTSGCRTPAPSVPEPDDLAAVDAGTNTIYASNDTLAQVDVINAATCNVNDLTGCAPVAKIPTAHTGAAIGAIDDSTHTLYVSDSGGTVSAVNTATCNATDTAGCAGPWPSINVGASPGTSVLDMATNTLYVPFGTSADEIAVVNTATCNTQVTTGCGQAPSTITVGSGTHQLAISQLTNTLYATQIGLPFGSGDTMAVVNGATCDATYSSGCGAVAATVKVGSGPYGVAVNDATNTVYVALNKDGDQPGTVLAIDGATCNGSDTAGCAASFPSIGVGRSPLLVSVNTSTDTVYVSDYATSSVSVINGAECNATATQGCTGAAPEQAVGSQPNGLAVDQSNGTVYALNSLLPGSMSIFGT